VKESTVSSGNIKDISTYILTYMQYLPATQRQTSSKKSTNPGRQNRPTQEGSYTGTTFASLELYSAFVASMGRYLANRAYLA